MSESDRSATDRLFDLVVYAPIGAAFHGPEVLGELAERGRAQVRTARVVGRLAVDGLRRDLDRRSLDARRLLGDAVVGVARATGAPLAGPPAGPKPATDADDGAAPGRPITAPGGGPRRHLHAVDDPPARRPGPDVQPVSDHLPIPGYDTLSASQVVPRLDDLTPDELDAVGEYERATRGRMTILNRIAQLRAS